MVNSGSPTASEIKIINNTDGTSVETANQDAQVNRSLVVKYHPLRLFRLGSLEMDVSEHNNMVIEAAPTKSGPVKLVGSPIDMSAAPVTVRHQPPTLGAHTDEILAVLGLEEEAKKVEDAVRDVIRSGARTADIAAPGEPSLSTTEMTSRVITQLA